MVSPITPDGSPPRTDKMTSEVTAKGDGGWRVHQPYALPPASASLSPTLTLPPPPPSTARVTIPAAATHPSYVGSRGVAVDVLERGLLAERANYHLSAATSTATTTNMTTSRAVGGYRWPIDHHHQHHQHQQQQQQVTFPQGLLTLPHPPSTTCSNLKPPGLLDWVMKVHASHSFHNQSSSARPPPPPPPPPRSLLFPTAAVIPTVGAPVPISAVHSPSFLGKWATGPTTQEPRGQLPAYGNKGEALPLSQSLLPTYQHSPHSAAAMPRGPQTELPNYRRTATAASSSSSSSDGGAHSSSQPTVANNNSLHPRRITNSGGSAGVSSSTSTTSIFMQCAHYNAKRLRSKKGFGYYLCCTCGARWKVPNNTHASAWRGHVTSPPPPTPTTSSVAVPTPVPVVTANHHHNG